MKSSPAAAAGDYVIQIGAFESAAEAEHRLATVRERAGAVLAQKTPVTQQITHAGKVLYRARYAGFQARTAAATACAELKRFKVECLAMKAD